MELSPISITQYPSIASSSEEPGPDWGSGWSALMAAAGGSAVDALAGADALSAVAAPAFGVAELPLSAVAVAAAAAAAAAVAAVAAVAAAAAAATLLDGLK